MLQQVQAGHKVVKSHYYAALSKRFGRTPKSFEFCLQNISYVYSLLGRGWLPGLKPASHVGASVAALLEELIAEVEGHVLAPVAGFETQVKELSKKTLKEPVGNQKPKATAASVTQFQRDPAVKAWVLTHAQGICECCSAPAPFFGPDSAPFLEVHHVRHLADGGPDTPSNAVAICPN